jgi:hypothetical protein
MMSCSKTRSLSNMTVANPLLMNIYIRFVSVESLFTCAEAPEPPVKHCRIIFGGTLFPRSLLRHADVPCGPQEANEI